MDLQRYAWEEKIRNQSRDVAGWYPDRDTLLLPQLLSIVSMNYSFSFNKAGSPRSHSFHFFGLMGQAEVGSFSTYAMSVP